MTVATPSTVRRVAAPPGGQTLSGRAGRSAWLFIAPNLIGFLCFTLVPLVAAIAIAFTDWNVVSGLDGIKFTGLANFTEALGSGTLWATAARTVLYAGTAVPLTMIGGLVWRCCSTARFPAAPLCACSSSCRTS